jgi:paraquat-inducible protein A
MRSDLEEIKECFSCGLFVKKDKQSSKKLVCPRCNSKLEKEHKHSIDSLIFSISALMLFIILNLYPIITLNINNQDLEATLFNTVKILFEQEFFIVGFLVLFTIIIAPVFNSLIIILFFIQEKSKIKIFRDKDLYNGFHFFKEWGFMEVFIISLIVTYIKLVGMISNTKFDIGFFVILIYVLCFLMSNLKFDIDRVFKD